MTTPLGQRLKEARKKADLTQSALATAVGISQSTYQELETGKSKKSAHLTEIADILKVDPHWLATGKGAPNPDDFVKNLLENATNPLLNESHNNEGRIWIDVVNIKFSCGDGESIEFHFNEVLEQISFDERFFKRHHVKPENMVIAHATGDSMEPYIRADDMFAIDKSDTEIRDGDVYAVYFEGEAMLKQIFKEEGGTLVLHSLNNKYRDKTVSSTNGKSFKVIGRQFWRAG